MHFLHDLRARLQDRRNRLYKVNSNEFDNELRHFLRFVGDNQYTSALIHQLKASGDTGLEQWEEETSGANYYQLPKSEEGRARVCYELLDRCATSSDEYESFNWAHNFSRHTGSDDAFAEFVETVVDPLVNFLHDRIDEMGNVLYLLQRFKVKAEWFMQKELHEDYLSNTRKGEEALDRALRSSLFEGGVDYPFSQPASPSGKADIVAALGSSDPLVLEVKVYDPPLGRDVTNVRQGFHQVLRYANDYNEEVGYLVVFNCSKNALLFQADGDSTTAFPPRLTESGKSFFLIGIDIGTDRHSASKESPMGRKLITREDLLGNASG